MAAEAGKRDYARDGTIQRRIYVYSRICVHVRQLLTRRSGLGKEGRRRNVRRCCVEGSYIPPADKRPWAYIRA